MDRNVAGPENGAAPLLGGPVVEAPADTQVLAEEQVLPWRIGKLDDARRADMLVEASETVIVRLARTGD